MDINKILKEQIFEAVYQRSIKIDIICMTGNIYKNKIELTVDIGYESEPDCIIGHFGYNIMFRTQMGIKKNKYKNLDAMIKSIISTCEKYNYNVQTIVARKSITGDLVSTLYKKLDMRR